MYVVLYNKIPELTLLIVVVWVIAKMVLSCLNLKLQRICVWSLFAVWVAFVLYITIFSRHMGEHKTELGIAHSYYKWLTESSEDAGHMIIMNIIMFIPGGMILSETFNISGQSKFIIPLVFLSCFSLVIEILQFWFGLGLAETDDVINNTLGAVAGYLLTGVLNKYGICRFK